jgi:hypothetical protein
MATRRLGLGTTFSVDKDNDGGSDAIALVLNAKPPTRERETIDNTTLGDTLQTNDPGIEKHSTYVIRLKLDKADAVHLVLISTLFDNKTETTWVIVFTDGTSETWTFDGWISKVEHQPVEHNKHNEVEITVERTTAITVS